MPALVAGIHVLVPDITGVDGRDRPAHDQRNRLRAWRLLRLQAQPKKSMAGGEPRPSPSQSPDPPIDYCSAAVRRLNVTVETKTTALPLNWSNDMPRYGSSEKVIITDVAGFTRCVLSWL